MNRGAWRAAIRGVTKSCTRPRRQHAQAEDVWPGSKVSKSLCGHEVPFWKSSVTVGQCPPRGRATSFQLP